LERGFALSEDTAYRSGVHAGRQGTPWAQSTMRGWTGGEQVIRFIDNRRGCRC
jgi:hypothetical protein